MITEKQRAERLRRHEELKGYYEMRLASTDSEEDKEHLEVRIAEVEGDIAATKLPEPKEILSKITETMEEEAKQQEDHKKVVKRITMENPF